MLTNNLFKRWTYKFFAPDLLQREAYESFKRLLEYDRRCHELIADFQDLYFKKDPKEWSHVVLLHNQLSKTVGAMANELAFVSSRNTDDLSTYYRKFDSYIRCLLQPESNPTGPPFITWLDDSRSNARIAGTKAANLAAIQQNFNFSVPTGFVVTANSWHALIEYNNLRTKIDSHLLTLDPSDNNSLKQTSRELMALIKGAKIPPEVNHALIKASQDLIARIGGNAQVRFAVRSSGVNEDGPNSFAGQYQSVLDISLEGIPNSYLHVLSSKYTPEAILYRITAGVSDTESSMAVLVIKMIAARGAGVSYTKDPTGTVKDAVLIHSVAGGGEKLVSGKVQPHVSIFSKKSNRFIGHPAPDSPISQKEAENIAKIAIEMERFFGSPQDIEWAIEKGEPYILQSRPLQTLPCSEKNIAGLSTKRTKKSDKILLPLLYHGGITAAQGQGAGPVFFLEEGDDTQSIPAGAILIVERTPPSLTLVLSQCNGVISSQGSVASHFSTICREFRVPLLVGATNISNKLISGEVVTIDANIQNVYRGRDTNFSTKYDNIRSRKNIPYYRRLQLILDFIAPLNILDPEADSFTPEFCRSFHDIVRFSHEKGVQAMFAIGASGSRSSRRKQLFTPLPFELYLIDVDKNWENEVIVDNSIHPDQVISKPFRALWQGLAHPSIVWGDHIYYNWKDYDSAAIIDGFAFKNKTESASYAICGNDYLNLNIRFGYHFTIIDTLCSEVMEQNYCSIRFAGGGGTFEGRYYRLQYVGAILRKLGFQVNSKTDLLDGRLDSLSCDQMLQRLVTVGRMLGTSKLMDMVLKDEESVASHLQIFFSHNDNVTD